MSATGDGEIRIKRLELGPWGTNAYVVTCARSGKTALVDAPGQAEDILAALRGLSVEYILMTHSHSDHVGALAQVKSALKAPVAIHPLDASRLPLPPDMMLGHGDTLPLGELSLRVIHTPGHTPGSLCFLTGKHLFSGDTLFPNGPGKTGTPGDFQRIVDSLVRHIFVLPDEALVYPGHGEGTVLGREKELFAAFRRRPADPQLCGDVLWVP